MAQNLPPLYLSGPILTCGPIFKSDPILRKQTQAQVRDLMNRERRDCSFCSHFMVYLLWFDLSGRRPCFLCSPICPPPDMRRGLKLELASSKTGNRSSTSSSPFSWDHINTCKAKLLSAKIFWVCIACSLQMSEKLCWQCYVLCEPPFTSPGLTPTCFMAGTAFLISTQVWVFSVKDGSLMTRGIRNISFSFLYIATLSLLAEHVNWPAGGEAEAFSWWAAEHQFVQLHHCRLDLPFLASAGSIS